MRAIKRYLMPILGLLLIHVAVTSPIVFANDSITIRVGVYENHPKIFTDDSGKAAGFWPDIIEYIASEEDWNIEYVTGTWTECLSRLETNEIDIMPDVAYTEERGKLYDFPNENTYVSWSSVYAKAGNDIQSILDLEGKTIAVFAGSSSVEGSGGIKELINAFHISCTLIEVDSYTRVFELVKSGEVDAGISNRDFANQHLEQFNLVRTAIIFQPHTLYFAFPKESSLTPYLIAKIDSHMKELKADSNSVYYQSQEKWLGVKPEEKTIIPTWVKWLFIGIGVAAGILVGGNYLLRSRVKSKTRELIEEIGERKQAEDALKTSEGKFRLMFHSVSEGIVCSDLDGNISDANRAAVLMFGYDHKDQVVGHGVFEYVDEIDHDRVIKNMMRTLETGITRDIEYIFVRKDGSRFPGELSSSVLSNESDGDPVGFITVIRDITERKKAEAEKLEMERKAQVTDRLASIGEMASGIAHEINNPLTSVVGFSELLMEKDLPEDLRQDVEIIYDSSQRVAGIVKGLLTFARQHKPVQNRTGINEIIESTLALRKYALETSNIEVEARFDNGLPWTVADTGQLQQVFLNIIVNAEAEMKKAHGRGRLTIRTERAGDRIRISFADDGPGIARENLERIFDPFFTTKEVGEGTGLGLSLSRGIITEHNGALYAESEEGKGATFFVELPIVTEEEEKVEDTGAIKASEKIIGGRILVVDDEPAILALLNKLLGGEGYDVATSGSGREALGMIKEQEGYDLIISDIRLPGLSGAELYDELGGIAPSLQKRVIFITGDVISANTREFLKTTGVPCVPKPFDIASLKEEVKRVITGEN
ncbi:MAG: transporter substrate-binding domain-containing protein [Dehalococcoidales bacterium]|nr:transporter substrate-binding domain-containing protein [Dehalococcoidales bacterium]